MELAEKDLEKESLKQSKQKRLPLFIKTREEEETLARLQIEENDLQEQVSNISREMGAIERPSTAMQQDLSEMDMDAKSKWDGEKEHKRRDLK